MQAASPLQVVASATSPLAIAKWQLFVDSTLIWEQTSSAPQISESIALSAGPHRIKVTATNTAGTSGSASTAVTIPGSATEAAASLSLAMAPIGSSSPTTISAAAQGLHPITGWALYVDSSTVYQQNTSANTLSQTVQLSTGQHQITVKVWDNTGALATVTATADIMASTSSATASSLIPTPPSSAQTWHQVEEKHGWSACGACAGNPEGTGPEGTFWFKQGVSSPSLDGNSMETYIGGGVPWADAVYAYHFGPQSWANHIIYTTHFRWSASDTRGADGNYVVQAVEFDSFFFSGGYKYMFGTQCGYVDKYWAIWNGVENKWKMLGLKCENFPPNQWHTVTWYGVRDQSKKKVHFVALAVDGKEAKVDAWMDATPSSTSDDSGIQFQQDSDRYGSPWYAWIDQVTVTIW